MNEIVTFTNRDASDTLAAFGLISQGDEMPRIHINLSDEFLAEIEMLCQETSIIRSRLIRKGIRMALDDARARFGTVAANSSSRPASIASVPRAFPAPAAPNHTIAKANGMPATIERGGGIWFDMQESCSASGVKEADLLNAIDVDDDVLSYAGRSWIDMPTVVDMIPLSKYPTLANEFWEWAKQVSTKTQHEKQ